MNEDLVGCIGFVWIMLMCFPILLFASGMVGLGYFVLCIVFLIGIMLLCNKRKINKEKKKMDRLKAVEDAITLFWDTYDPRKSPSNKKPAKVFSEEYPPNLEVVECVNKYKRNNEEIHKQLKTLHDEIHSILLESTKNDDKESSLAFLTQNKARLSELKTEFDSLLKTVNGTKIKLLGDTNSNVVLLRDAFAHLNNSQKLTQDAEARLNELLNATKPTDLEMFDFRGDPLMLRFEKCIFCFFEKVILVFDSAGVFYTAIDPSALEIKIKRLKSKLTVVSEEITYDEFTDTDSKCAVRGNTFSTWLHTCRDGSPDLRYSYNPIIEYRTDVMEYGTIELRICDYILKYTTSSSEALDAMATAKKAYCKSYRQYHNPIPSLLTLFDLLLGDQKHTIADVKSKCSANSDGYFCKIIDTK